MHVTVCICTRNRTDSLARALNSLAASHYADFEVIVVDQSASDETSVAIHTLRDTLAEFPQLTYIRSTTTGSSVAHNIAVRYATGDVIAFTDDDCEVPPQWIDHIVSYIETHPGVAQICGSVLAGPHDQALGFVPTCSILKERQLATPWLKWREGGIGANMAFRLDALRSVGPFDEMLGTGAPLYSCLDGDITYRMLKAGYTVASVPGISVMHHGFRTWTEGRELMRRCGIGVAAAYTKHLRLGDMAVLPTLLFEWMRCISWRRLLTLRQHSGLRRFLAFAQGIRRSFCYRLDRTTRTYRATVAYGDVNTSPPDVQVLVLPACTQAVPVLSPPMSR